MQHDGWHLLFHLAESLLIYNLPETIFDPVFFYSFILTGSEAERIPAEDYVEISGIFHEFLIESSQT